LEVVRQWCESIEEAMTQHDAKEEPEKMLGTGSGASTGTLKVVVT
jgi:hypothetical protein